jgi:hypothetical protein
MRERIEMAAWILAAIVASELENNKEKSGKSVEEQIQDKILSLPDIAITAFMQTIGNWNEDKHVIEYSPLAVAALVEHGNNRGWDVKVEIERGKDYHVVGKHVRFHGVDTYLITGLPDEFDAFAELLDIHALVGEIAQDKEKQEFLDFLVALYS